MRAVHAIWAMDRQGGGTSAAVAGLSDALEEAACPVTLIFGQARESTEALTPRHAHSVIVRALRLGRHTVAIPGLAAATRQALAEGGRCVLHSHGLWTPVGPAMARLSRQSGAPLVVSPHGMLEPPALAERRWRKDLALSLGQRAALEAARLLVATSPREAQNLRRLGFKQPIAVVPIGVDVPEHPAPHDEAAVRQALFLGRVHPIKGLPLLIEAWSRVRPRGWRCLIAGPDQLGHRASLERQIRACGLSDDFEFLGNLDPAHKERLYRNSDLFVLPSLSENFGIVVAEALSYGLPVLATRGAPWGRLVDCGAGWWVDPSADGLEQGLRAACATTVQQRAAIGSAGRRMACAELQWSTIGARMARCYEWLLERNGPVPDCILL